MCVRASVHACMRTRARERIYFSIYEYPWPRILLFKSGLVYPWPRILLSKSGLATLGTLANESCIRVNTGFVWETFKQDLQYHIGHLWYQ